MNETVKRVLMGAPILGAVLLLGWLATTVSWFDVAAAWVFGITLFLMFSWVFGDIIMESRQRRRMKRENQGIV